MFFICGISPPECRFIDGQLAVRLDADGKRILFGYLLRSCRHHSADRRLDKRDVAVEICLLRIVKILLHQPGKIAVGAYHVLADYDVKRGFDPLLHPSLHPGGKGSGDEFQDIHPDGGCHYVGFRHCLRDRGNVLSVDTADVFYRADIVVIAGGYVYRIFAVGIKAVYHRHVDVDERHLISGLAEKLSYKTPADIPGSVHYCFFHFLPSFRGENVKLTSVIHI